MKTLLRNITLDNNLHAKWLNTLAYLEHIGSRKIMKSQNSRYLNLETLQHIVEEARHAFYLKKILEHHFPNQCPTFEANYLLGKDAGDKYFQGLDQSIDKAIEGNTKLKYLYVTFIIEERALWLYGIYQEVLSNCEMGIRLTPLIKEEENHLKETKMLLEASDELHKIRITHFKQIEEQLYQDFIASLSNEVHGGHNVHA